MDNLFSNNHYQNQGFGYYCLGAERFYIYIDYIIYVYMYKYIHMYFFENRLVAGVDDGM